ncbi:MAG: hypothetical protein ACYTG3_01105 [Planctomycetota bacterium]|jgi:hypothetical protein
MGLSGSGGRVRRPRRDATIIRFHAERLASGLYRHRAVKLIMTVKGEQTGVRWK